MVNSLANIEEIKSVAEAIIGVKINKIEIASRGANSSIFKATDINSKDYAVKIYPNDSTQRQQRESFAFNLLASNDIQNIPYFFGADTLSNISVMQWIDSSSPLNINEDDIVTCSEFIASIMAISKNEYSEKFLTAKQACFSGNEIIDQVEDRISRLLGVSNQNKILDPFLNKEVIPMCKELIRNGKNRCSDLRIELNQTLSPDSWRIIPADFGFQNTLRKVNGSLEFFDFEYFGWDDPVKGVTDFILHPSYFMPKTFKEIVSKTIFQNACLDHLFFSRLYAFTPFYIGRWSLIMLNNFLAHQQLFLKNASSYEVLKESQKRQVIKVREYLTFQNNNFPSLLPYK
jgi:hypothetical protein